MPNVTIHIPAEQMPPDQKLAELTGECLALCTGLLRAALENVHVLFLPVRHGHGHAVFAQVHHRLEAFRTPATMSEFMEGLDAAIARCTGLSARVRCFGYAASTIHARN